MFGTSQTVFGGGSSAGLVPDTTAQQPAKRKSMPDTSSAQTVQTQSQPPVFGGTSTTPSLTSMFTPPIPSSQPQGLLGAAPGPSAPSGGSSSFLGGTSSQAQLQSQQSQQPSLGASILNNAPQGQFTQQQAFGQSQSRDPAHFNSLLERQKKRQRFASSAPNGRVAQLPSFDMDLGDLARRAKEIGGSGPKTTSVNGPDSRAHYLLAGSGISPGKATKEFQKVDRDGKAASAYQPTEPFDPDNEKYVRRLQERGREAMVQDAIDRVYRDFDMHLEESLSIDFEEQKKKIMQHFGLIAKDDGAGGADGAQQDKGGFERASGKKELFEESAKGSTRSVFGRSGLEKSLIGTPARGASTTSFFGDSATVSGNNVLLAKGQNGRYLRDKERFFSPKGATTE